MEKISIDFVYEFAKDLKKMLETIKSNGEYSVYQRKPVIKDKIVENSSELVEELYEKYKDYVDLKLRKIRNKCNLEFRNSINEVILIPEDLFKSSHYIEFKDNFEMLLILMRNDNISLNEFSFRLTRLIDYSNNKINSLNSNTLEKIRFFITFVNAFPNYVTGNKLPLETKDKNYHALYSSWGRTKTYQGVYNRYILNDTRFFKHHLWINQIPNYPVWNISMMFCNEENIDQFPNYTEAPIYPLQVIENMDGSFHSILFLMSNRIINDNLSVYKPFKIESFSIINNFNVFHGKNSSKRGIKVELQPIFKSFNEFFDHYIQNKDKIKSNNMTFQFSLNFKKIQDLDPLVDQIKNKNTIKLFNSKYKVKNDFDRFYSSVNSTHSNPYRTLFKNRYSFPDFNALENFILRIKKKKNKLFQKTVIFFKTWTYQILMYELKDSLVFYGFLPLGFNYNKELPIIHEILNNLETGYELLINNKTFKQSTLSLYYLPSSNQFLDENFEWNFNTFNLSMSINQKEELINSQINEDLVNGLYI